MDGAGPQRGRKDGPPKAYLEPPDPHGSPFFFGSQKPFLFFRHGSEMGFERFPVSRRPLIRRLRRHLPPLRGEGFAVLLPLWTFPLPGGRWPEGPDEGALQAWFGAPGRRAPQQERQFSTRNTNHAARFPLIRHLLRKCHHGSRKRSFLLTVHRTVRPPGEGLEGARLGSRAP